MHPPLPVAHCFALVVVIQRPACRVAASIFLRRVNETCVVRSDKVRPLLSPRVRIRSKSSPPGTVFLPRVRPAALRRPPGCKRADGAAWTRLRSRARLAFSSSERTHALGRLPPSPVSLWCGRRPLVACLPAAAAPLCSSRLGGTRTLQVGHHGTTRTKTTVTEQQERRGEATSTIVPGRRSATRAAGPAGGSAEASDGRQTHATNAVHQQQTTGEHRDSTQ
jgi:hypothetical protein